MATENKSLGSMREVFCSKSFGWIWRGWWWLAALSDLCSHSVTKSGTFLLLPGICFGWLGLCKPCVLGPHLDVFSKVITPCWRHGA